MYQLIARLNAIRSVSANAIQGLQLYDGFVDFWLRYRI